MSDFELFTEEQIASLRKGGKILRGCLDHVSAMVKPGITTQELDDAAEEYIRNEGAEPGFKGYQKFPATLCTSINEQCVHGLPSDRALEEGDIIAIDCGVLLDGLYTDACVSVPVGSISDDAQKLLDTTDGALKAAVGVVRAGAHTGDISATVQQFVESAGFTIVRPLTGHGLGTTLHQFPDVPNFGEAGGGYELPAGTIIAIEPIVSAGSGDIHHEKDGWTLSIADSALSAHFEHTVLVREKGCEILA